MVSSVFLVLLFCWSTLADTEGIHKITKREAEQPSELQLENELRRVKRLMITNNNDQALARVKRLKRDRMSEIELSRIKRLKRSFLEPDLSRVKRTRRSSDFVLPELSRVKRFKSLDLDYPELSRVKRLTRAARGSLQQSVLEPSLSRAKRTRRATEFVLPELSRVKRVPDPNTFELARVKRLKRAILGPDTHLVRAKRAKRIPSDVHKMKRIRNYRKLEHRNRALSDKMIKNRKRNLYKMKKSQEKHLRALRGKKYNLENHADLGAIKDTLSGATGNVRKRHRNLDVGTFKQHVQNRLRERHFHQKRIKQHKSKVKKDRHHVKSHKLNKKNVL